jgi:hypothetical protein
VNHDLRWAGMIFGLLACTAAAAAAVRQFPVRSKALDEVRRRRAVSRVEPSSISVPAESADSAKGATGVPTGAESAVSSAVPTTAADMSSSVSKALPPELAPTAAAAPDTTTVSTATTPLGTGSTVEQPARPHITGPVTAMTTTSVTLPTSTPPSGSGSTVEELVRPHTPVPVTVTVPTAPLSSSSPAEQRGRPQTTALATAAMTMASTIEASYPPKETILLLLAGETSELTFRTSSPVVYTGPRLVPTNSSDFRSQALIKLMPAQEARGGVVHLDVPEPQRPNQERAGRSDTAITVTVCGRSRNDVYLFGVDPRKDPSALPLYANAGGTTKGASCVNEARVEVPQAFLAITSYAVVESQAATLSLPTSATVTLREESTTSRSLPWNVQALAGARDASSVQSQARVFVLASAPLRQHDDLKQAAIEKFFAGPIDPFCDPTGTGMVALIAGKALGVAQQARIVPIPIYGCSVSENQLNDIRSGLATVASNLADAPLTTRIVVVVQDSADLQSGLRDRAFEPELKRLYELGAVVFMPNSNCTSTSAADLKYVSVAPFGIDGASAAPFVSKDHMTCTNAFDLVSPGIDVVSAGTFGERSRQDYSGSSMAAASCVGAVLTMSGGARVESFNTERVKRAILSLPLESMKGSDGSASSPKVRTIGYGNISAYRGAFASALVGQHAGNFSASASSKNDDRIVQSLSNPTFYGITAGVAVVCLATVLGIVILVSRRRPAHDETPGALEEEASVEEPKSPSAAGGSTAAAVTSQVADLPTPLPRPGRGDWAASRETSPARMMHRDRQNQSRPPVGKDIAEDAVPEENDGRNPPKSASKLVPKIAVEPLHISRGGIADGHNRTTPAPTDSSFVQRGDTASSGRGLGKRHEVKTRLLTLTKTQKPPETPGASKASWFATPKAGAAPQNNSFTARSSSAKHAGVEAADSEANDGAADE